MEKGNQQTLLKSLFPFQFVMQPRSYLKISFNRAIIETIGYF